MASTQDVSPWPIEARLSGFEAISGRVDQTLRERYPDSQGYVHSEPYLHRDSARLSCTHKVTRGDGWGVGVFVEIDTLTEAPGQQMRLSVNRAIPSQDAMATRSVLTGIVAAIGAAVWAFMRMRGGDTEAGQAILLAALAGVAAFGVVGLLVFAIQRVALGGGAHGAAVDREIASLEKTFDLPAIFSAGENEYYEFNE